MLGACKILLGCITSLYNVTWLCYAGHCLILLDCVTLYELYNLTWLCYKLADFSSLSYKQEYVGRTSSNVRLFAFTACSGTSYLYASGVQDKILASPNYPSQYTNNLDCTWIISTSSGQQINISFSTLELESCCDFVEIRDGQYSSSRLLAKYSGSKSAFSFVSSGTKLRIRFTTDGSNTRQGFRASYGASAMLPTTAPTVWGTAPYYSNSEYKIGNGAIVCTYFTVENNGFVSTFYMGSNTPYFGLD